MTMLPQKMKKAGYATAMSGKWHLGARSLANLPINRGFDSHLGFLKGGEDHQTQMSSEAPLRMPDLWHGQGPAVGMNGTYSTFLYGREAVRVVETHDTSKPLFMYLAFQTTHSPYEVPPQYLNNSVPYEPRRVFNAMVSIMDEAIGNLTAALASRNMLDDTLIVFSADNGGVYHGNQRGNNYPLRGQKTSSWEGGVRATAAVWGGANVMPAELRGTENDAFIHVSDWYATFCHLAGVDPTDRSPAALAGDVPPIDSINQWETLVTPRARSGPRTEIPLSWCFGDNDQDECIETGYTPNGTVVMPRNAALINGTYKLVYGMQFGFGVWTGPVFPNGTDPGVDNVGCPNGCLFDIFKGWRGGGGVGEEKPGRQQLTTSPTISVPILRPTQIPLNTTTSRHRSHRSSKR